MNRGVFLAEAVAPTLFENWRQPLPQSRDKQSLIQYLNSAGRLPHFEFKMILSLQLHLFFDFIPSSAFFLTLDTPRMPAEAHALGGTVA